MDWRTLKILWMMICGLLVGLLIPVRTDSPCDISKSFACRSDPTICISLIRVRDGSSDCPDRSDEECNTETEFQCQTIHQCIPKLRLHDGWPDCDDGSDEECARGQYRCRCGLPHCIDAHKVKDGVKDCDDGSDEDDRRNKTEKCPDESGLQDLMAIERRKKRQIDLRQKDEAPSVEEKIKPFEAKDYYSEEALPSVGNYMKLQRELSATPQYFSSISANDILKVSRQTEIYGSLKSGRIYQTAVNVPISSISASEYTAVMDGNEGIQKKNSLRFTKLQAVNMTDEKKNRAFHWKTVSNVPNIYPTKTFKNKNDANKNERALSVAMINSEKEYRNRKLLSVDPLKETMEGIEIGEIENIKKRSTDDDIHIPLIYSSEVTQSNLYPTGLVTSKTGIDIIDGRTTEWTTLIEGTYISGTYAHVVRSTSKIFLTVTKTLSVMSISPSMTSLPESPTVTMLREHEESKGELQARSKDKIQGYETTTEKDFEEDCLWATVATDSSRGNIEITNEELTTETINNSTSANENDNQSVGTMTAHIETEVMNSNSTVNGEAIGTTLMTTPYAIELTTESDGIFSEIPLLVGIESFESSVKNASVLNSEGNVTITDTVNAINNINHTLMNPEKGNSRDILSENITMLYGSQITRNENVIDTKSMESELHMINESISFPIMINSFTSEINSNSLPAIATLSNIDMSSQIEILEVLPKNSDVNPFDNPPIFETTQATDSLATVSITNEFNAPDNLKTKSFLEVNLLGSLNSPINAESITSKTDEIQLQPSASPVWTAEKVTLTPSLPHDVTETNSDNKEAKRVKRVVNEKVTILRPDGRIVTTDADVVLTPATHYTTFTYYTTILKPGGGTSVVSQLRVESSVVNPRIDGNLRFTTAPQHHAGGDGHCCETATYDRHTPVVIRDGDGYVAIPIEDHHHADPQPIDPARHVTHHTTYTYFTTELRGGVPFVRTRYETETNLTPLHRPDVHDYTRRQSVPIRFGGTQPIATHVIDTRLHRPSDVTHRTTYTYHTTRLRGGNPIVNTREETETRVTHIPTYYRPGVDPGIFHATYADHTHRINPTLIRPDAITHRTTYTYHTTRFQEGVPVVNTRRETETNVTPIPTYRHRPHVTRVNEAQRPAYTSLAHDHDPNEPYITHRTTYTYYTTRFRGGTSYVETRKETDTNITPNPTYRYNRGIVTDYYEDCATCQNPNRAVIRNPVNVQGHRQPENAVIRTNLPSTVTHYTTYTYATTVLPRNEPPRTRTRQHTVTQVISNAVLPSLHNEPGERTRVYTFGERIRSKRTIAALNEDISPTRTLSSTISMTAKNKDGLKKRQQSYLVEKGTKKVEDSYRETKFKLEKKIYFRDVDIDLTNLKPSTLTLSSTYSVTKLQDMKPPINSPEHIFPYLSIPTVLQMSQIQPQVDSKVVEETSELSSLPVKRKLMEVIAVDAISLPDEISLQQRQRNPEISFEILKAEENLENPIVITPITYYTTHTYYTTALKPGGQTVVQTNIDVSSSIYFPTRQDSHIAPPSNRRIRKIRRKKLSRNGTTPLIHSQCPECKETVASSEGDTATYEKQPVRTRTRVRKIRVRKPVHTELQEGSFDNNRQDSSKARPHKERRVENDRKISTSDIKPTRITFYSTYTYFTTELHNGRPITKSREHTVTEILSDVVVPTVLSLRSNNRLQNMKNAYNRNKRETSDHRLSTPIVSSFSGYSGEMKDKIQHTPVLKKLDNFDLNTSFRNSTEKKLYNEKTSSILEDVWQPEAAEVNYDTIHRPSTQYFTNTYYTTILKPGGNRVVESSVHVSSSVYTPAYRVGREYRGEKDIAHRHAKPHHSSVSVIPCYTCDRHVDKVPYYPYRPTFAPKVVLPDRLGNKQIPCITCYSNQRRNNLYNREFKQSSYVTSLPVKQINGRSQSIHDRSLNHVNYNEPAIKPTHVTFYSTYTYFTTELKNGHPSVRTREHTVTEILTDVVVPTVTPIRSKRDTDVEAYGMFQIHSLDSQDDVTKLGRKLLQVTENDEVSTQVIADMDSQLESNSIIETEVDYNNTNKNEVITHQYSELADEESLHSTLAYPEDLYNSTDLQFVTSDISLLISSRRTDNKEISSSFANVFLANSYSEKFDDRGGIERNDILYSSLSLTPRRMPELSKNVFVTPPLSSGFTSTVRTDVTRNGKVTRFTTTIYGTYINGFHAQRAVSQSEVASLPEMMTSKGLDMNPIYSPSRSEGLVSIKVSKMTRGPLAIHFTTEIHGTYVAGAYAQTARVYTSYQRLSTSTQKDSSKSRIQSTSVTTYAGPRKTGLLTSRVLRTKIDDGTTVLLVSEIHGTYIGGAYAHLGTYVTRTLNPSPAKVTLPTYRANEVETGLITSSVSDKITKGTTTRYHYEVYGTFLDGTYAHVPSARKEVIQPTKLISNIEGGYLSNYPYSSFSDIPSAKGRNVGNTIQEMQTSYDGSNTMKIGLIEASSRAHVRNGTTTLHIYEVHGTYLNGMYAHVPSISYRIVTPMVSEMLASYAVNTSLPYPDLIVENETDNASKQYSAIKPIINNSDDIESANDNPETIEDEVVYDIRRQQYEELISSEMSEDGIKNKRTSSHITLLPEELRIAYGNSFNPLSRVKRAATDVLPDIQSSFSRMAVESILHEDQKNEQVVTSPLSNSDLTYAKYIFVKDADRMKKLQKLQSEKKRFSPNMNSNTEQAYEGNIRVKRSTFKRFGVSSETRKARSSSITKTTYGKTSSTRSYGYVAPSKSITSSKLTTRSTTPSVLSKRPLLFPARNRGKHTSSSIPVLESSMTEMEISMSTSIATPTKTRKFGKPSLSTGKLEMIDVFEASEAVVRSITDQKILASTRRSRNLNLLRGSSNTGKRLPSTFRRNGAISKAQSANIRSTNLRGFRNRKTSSPASELELTATDNLESSASSKRFTLTTSSYSIKLKPTSSFFTAMEENEDNNLNDENTKSTQRSEKSSGFRRSRGGSRKSPLTNEENEVSLNKPKALPLPPFGRSRGFKRPSTFDPRTLKESSTSSTSTIIYITNTPTSPPPIERADLDEDDLGEEEILNTPVTITSVITTTKTLPVHLGQRTSYATLTTTTYSTSVIQPDDLTTVSNDGITRTIVSTKTSIADNPSETIVTEFFLTTTEIDTTSLLAIKMGYGTRTDTIIARQILTTLATQVNTVTNTQTNTLPVLPQYPYFPNPFLPPLPTPNPFLPQFQTINPFLPHVQNPNQNIFAQPFLQTSATVIAPTSIPNPIVIPTATQPEIGGSFFFSQPSFNLASVTTPVTVHFTADNGEVISIVTLVTVPVVQHQEHSRVLRSVEAEKYQTVSPIISHSDIFQIDSVNRYFESDSIPTLKSSSSKNEPQSIHKRKLSILEAADNLESDIFIKEDKCKNSNFDFCKTSSTFKKRKLLQISDEDSYASSFEPERKHSNLFTVDTEIAASPTEKRDDDDSVLNSNPETNLAVDLPNDPLTFDSFFIGPGYNEEHLGRPIPSVRVVPTRRAYVRRIRPGNTQPQPIPEEPFRNIPFDNINIPPNPHNFHAQRFSANRLQPQPQPFALPHLEEQPFLPEHPSRNQIRRPTFPENNLSPQNRRVIRLRRPGSVPVPQIDPHLLGRKPIVNSPESNEYIPLRARGPALGSNVPPPQDVRNEVENDVRRPNVEDSTFNSNTIPSTPIPLTFYTTFTYMTTFLNGPSTAYSTREAVVSNVATETLNPTLIELIRYRGGFTTTQGVQTAVPLGSRAHGPSTTVVNLASRIQVYNSDVYYSQPDETSKDGSDEVGKIHEESKNEESVINTLPIADVAKLPKTYYTLFTYYYTLHDGDKSTYSQRSEVISNIATDAEPFLKQSFSETIDKSGYLTITPDKELINLGSRAAAGLTTEVNLELRTLVHFDNLRNVALDRQNVRPTLVEIQPTVSRDDANNNYLEPGDAEVQDQNTYPQTIPIDPSFSFGTTQNSGASGTINSNAETPHIPDVHVVRTQPLRGPIRVASTKVQRPGSLRSGVFVPRPGVRVRVRPAGDRGTSNVPELDRPGVVLLPNRINEDSLHKMPNDDSTDDDSNLDIDDAEDDDVEEDTEEEEPATAGANQGSSPAQGRRRLKITIRRPPDSSGGSFSPTRTRPRFYVVTRTGSPGPGRQNGIRPVSVKLSRRPRPSEQPRYETFTTVTSVPVIFGLSTTFRSAIVTSSSLVLPEDFVTPVSSSKTLVLTYFTTTTYTVPFTVSGQVSLTTFEETNSRVVTETVDADADLSFVSTTLLEGFDKTKITEPDLKKMAKTLSPVQLYNNAQTLNVGNRHNLVTRVSNGVTLIVASDGDLQPTEPAIGTLQPTTLTDALLMMDKDFTTIYQPRTFYTTFTFFTTFFSGSVPSISTSEQIVTNVYTIPITRPLRTEMSTTSDAEYIPITLVDTTEQIVSTTVYKTHTFYATLFNGSETIVTPIEELQPSVTSSTETFTITKTVLSAVSTKPDIRTSSPDEVQISETTLYKTHTNYVTLFRGSESIVSALEEIVPEVITLTLGINQPSDSKQPYSLDQSYTTRTIQATNTHYVTLFSGGEQILSSITEVSPSVITEMVHQIKPEATFTSSPTVISVATSQTPNLPVYQDLVPSVRTEYTTLTYFTTLYQDSSTILSSREEIATSYVTLFVPLPVGTSTESSKDNNPTLRPETQVEKVTTYPSKPAIFPTSTAVLTFYTTYTYYTTLFRGTETIISDSETVVTQYVTIETTPTDSIPQISTTSSISISMPSLENADVRVESSSSSVTLAGISATVDVMRLSDLGKEIRPTSSIPDEFVTTQATATSPSILTGTPITDANGATHILFTDFIVPESPDSTSKLTSVSATPALPDAMLSSNRLKTSTSRRFGISRTSSTTVFVPEYDTSQTRDTVSDMATTRVTDMNVVTHLPFRPTTSFNSGGTQGFGIKPGAVIDLSDVLGNTNLVGNLGETIKDIVNLFAAGNRNRNISNEANSDNTGPVLPSGGVPVSNAEEPLYIPIGAIGRGPSSTVLTPSRPGGLNRPPATLLSGFTPVSRFGGVRGTSVTDENLRAQEDHLNNARTSIVFGTNTIYLDSTMLISENPTTSLTTPLHSEMTALLSDGEVNSRSKSPNAITTPMIVTTDSTSIITGVETIFFAMPDGRVPAAPIENQVRPTKSSSVIGVETIFFEHNDNIGSPSNGDGQITGETTIFGSFPIMFGSMSSIGISPPHTDSTKGDTTIFFPNSDANKNRPSSPGTKYVTSVESVTLTLTLTTSSVYQSQDIPITVTSVFTTTIPPRTFVSTIIGSRTILGTQPEPTEAVQVISTMQPSESTTTVTTTTLIFNSIATTVVRTLVIPTRPIRPTDSIGEASTIPEILAAAENENRRSSPNLATAARKPVQLFKSGNRPTSATTPKSGPTGPSLKLFPTKPPTTTTSPTPPRPSTTRKTGFRKPGKALVPHTDGCATECNLKNREVCKQNPDRSWSCQCRPGFFKKKGSDECRDVKSYTVIVRVQQMGGNEVIGNQDLSDVHSAAYQNFTTTARKAVDEAYKLSSVGDEYVNANVLGVSAAERRRDGVLVNLTVTLTGDKPTTEVLLKDELVQSLEASASEAIETNATHVSAIIQRVEDVQDFDECADDSYNDCSRSSSCVNLPGTYTCECREGYQDLEPLLPGRICSGEIQDCDFCNNRGVCIMTEDDQKFCRCYRMYLGKQCEINGLVLAIALPIALALLILTMFCLLCGCRKLRRRRTQKSKANVFKGMVPPMAGTLDRKAMIMDSSSESSNDHAKVNHGYDSFGGEASGSHSYRRDGRRSRSNSIEDRISDDYGVPTVVIPRARHQHSKQVNHPMQPSSYHRTQSPYDDHW